MEPPKNRTILFIASCISLLTTSMVFAIRGDIEADMAAAFALSKEQMGLIWGPAFWGFTVGILICGVIVDLIGMKTLHILSALGYIGGVTVVLLAPKPEMASVSSIFDTTGTRLLYFGFLGMGISQGLVEGVINPLAATMYSDRKTRILNILHAWWPAGMIIGGLLAFVLTKFGVVWQIKLSCVMVPAVVYLGIALTQKYPQTERVAKKIPASVMFKEVLNPFFLLFFGLMWITAASELAPDQWFPSVMKEITGIEGILFLVYTAGLMFVLRFFFGGLVHRFNPFAVLATCALLAGVGLYGLGSLTPGSSVIAAFGMATIFGIGKTFFWPLMLGVTSERCPKGGALLINLMGGAGMLSIAAVLPKMGALMDKYDASVALKTMAVLPGFLLVAFAVIGLVYKAKNGSYKPVEL